MGLFCYLKAIIHKLFSMNNPLAEGILKTILCFLLGFTYLLAQNMTQTSPLSADNLTSGYRHIKVEHRALQVKSGLSLQDSIAVCIGLNKFKYPGIVFAQGVIESAGFSSALFRMNNNVFGMRKPIYRETLATGEAYGFATFKNWSESIADLRIHYSAYIDDMPPERLPRYLNNVYAHSGNYWAAVTELNNRNKYEAYINGLVMVHYGADFCKIADI